MQSAQKSEDIDPGVVAIAPKNKESMFGYQRIAKEVIASIEDRLEELMSRQSSETRQVTYRRPLGGGLMRTGVVVLLIVGAVGAFLAWQVPRNETVARWMPQSVVDLLSSRQDMSAEQGSLGESGMRMGSSYRSMSDTDNMNSTAASIDQSPLVQRMAQDIATLQQSMDQLRAGQDQMMRMMTRTSPLNAQARTAVAPLAPAAPRVIGPQPQTTGLSISPPPAPRRSTVIVPPLPR
jgi:hypothetical protein